MKPELMSKNIITIMHQLSNNQAIARLLTHNTQNPFDVNLPDIKGIDLIKVNSETARIHPYPFDPDANIKDSSFIRVYYNNGDFDESEVIIESQIHIDVIVAKSLWLINDNNDTPLIRPYEIINRVTSMVGRRSVGSSIKLKFNGWQHLAVNNKFDAIRLYAEYMSVST